MRRRLFNHFRVSLILVSVAVSAYTCGMLLPAGLFQDIVRALCLGAVAGGSLHGIYALYFWYDTRHACADKR